MAFTMLLLPCCAPRCAAHMKVGFIQSRDKEMPSHCCVPEALLYNVISKSKSEEVQKNSYAWHTTDCICFHQEFLPGGGHFMKHNRLLFI